MTMIKNGVVGDWRLCDEDFLRSFRLPSTHDKTESLRGRHPLTSDRRIAFDEESHSYTVDGNLVPLSVTGLIHGYSRGFDASEAIRGMRPDTREKYAERGLKTDEDIKSAWNKNAEIQRGRGTLMHFQIEQYLNGCQIEPPHSPEFQQFTQLFNSISFEQQPYRTELSVFSHELNIAGQIDGLFLMQDGTFAIWDWKRCKTESVFALLDPPMLRANLQNNR